jgi:hypothetical protein
MKRLSTILAALVLTIAASAQTLNVQVGSVTYQFPASQTGEMTYSGGATLTIMGKTFTIADIRSMAVDDSSVADGTVGVSYNGSTASVVVAGNVAQYLTIEQSGAHVSIAQSSDLAEEITYTLSGSSTDGEFYMSGSYKATVELNGLTLTNTNPVFSGAAVHIQNGKRIKVKPITGTTSTLTDAAGGSQKGCLYIKGHAEFAQKGTLNVTGNVKHAIKAGEYISMKNATLNVLGAVGDGISCNQFFLMESGTVNISGTGDDGIQCDLEGTESTGETTDHEDEDTGNIYISGGTITINAEAIAAKGIKCAGDMNISGGTLNITTTGKGMWDTDDLETKAACCLSADGNMNISGGTMTLKSTGSGGKGMKCDNMLTITDGTINVTTTGALYYNNGTTENTNYTGNTDQVSSQYYSSPKGIKAGTKTETGTSWQNGRYVTTYNYSGGIVISGGTITVTTSGRNGEGIESKNTLVINGGHITVNAYDDAINAAQDLTINAGYIHAHATNNDGIDSNGNLYIKGGVVYAIGATNPELAIDANSEEQKKLYFTGGTLVAIGGLESGSSLSQSCYSSWSWNKNTWYALYNGGTLALAFKTPASGGSRLVVSTSGTTSLKSGVSVSGGTEYFGGEANIGGTVSGGSTVSLSSYTGGGGGPGGGPGGW